MDEELEGNDKDNAVARPRRKPKDCQLKPSKWPFKIRSPIGDGALRGLAAELTVADRRGLLMILGVVDEMGGGLGGEEGPVV